VVGTAEAGVATADAGATEATAEAMAARRANSRRVIRSVLALLGVGVSSIKRSRLCSVCEVTHLLRTGRRLLKGGESVNSAEGQVKAKEQGGRVIGTPHSLGICVDVNTKEFPAKRLVGRREKDL